MNPDEPLDKVKEKMKPVISYFEKLKTIYTGSDKEAKKLRYSSYYNLAKIYLYLMILLPLSAKLMPLP